MSPTTSSSSLRFRAIGRNVTEEDFKSYVFRLHHTAWGRSAPSIPMTLPFSLAAQSDELTATVTFPSPRAKREAVKARQRAPPKTWVSDDLFDGLTILRAPEEVDTDVCAVHGLGGNAFDTWSSTTKMWLRDFLPFSQSFQKSRIMTFGYDSTLVNKKSTDRIRDWADELLRQVGRVRRSETEQLRPCIFICHSLGGMVAREAMLQLNSLPHKFEGITLEVCGLIFLSTPHSGSMEADWSDLLANVLESTVGLRSHAILDQLRPFNALSVDSIEAFASMKVIPPFHCLVEGDKTRMAGKDRLIVSENSAGFCGRIAEKILGVDHHGVCKFDNKYGGYAQILHQLQGIQNQLLAHHIFGNRAGKIPGLPSVVAPRYPAKNIKYYTGVGIRLAPSSKIVGRTTILESISSMVSLDESSPARLIGLTGIGGIGKTEILLELALRYRRLRNVFFIRAHDTESLDCAFLNLANAVGHDLLDWRYPSQDVSAIWRDLLPPERVQAFRDWLGTQENDQSLFIVDDIDGLVIDDAIEAAIPSEAKVVLYSTRDPRILHDSRPADNEIQISTMDNEEMTALIKLLLNHTRYLRQDPLAEESLELVAKAVQGHALAACRAVQYIDHVISQTSESPIPTFLKFMKGSNWRARKDYIEFKPRGHYSIMETYELSLKRLRQHQHETIRLLQLISFLSDFEGTLDFRKFFDVSREWLPDLKDELPDFDMLSYRLESLGKYLAEMETVSLGFRAPWPNPLRFHAIWLECVYQGLTHADRVRLIRQIVLLCTVSIVTKENANIFSPFKSNAIDIGRRFGIGSAELEASAFSRQWLTSRTQTLNARTSNELPPASTESNPSILKALDLLERFSALADDYNMNNLNDIEESRTSFQLRLMSLLRKLKDLDNGFQSSTHCDRAFGRAMLDLYDITIDIFRMLKNAAMIDRMRNIRQRVLARVEEVHDSGTKGGATNAV